MSFHRLQPNNRPSCLPFIQHPLERFHQELGHTAISRHNTLWHAAGRFSLVTFPSNQLIEASKIEIQQLLVDYKKLVAVFCPLTGRGSQINEYWLDTKTYGLSSLQRQFRSHIREHQQQFVSRELSWQEMAGGALAIHADVAQRRGPTDSVWTDLQRWQDVCSLAASIDALTAYGCLINTSIAGYVVAWRDQGICHGVLINRNSRFDQLRTGNILIYNFSRDQISRTDTSAINLGRSWYPAKTSLDRFKRYAGFDERHTTLAVVLHPRLEAMLHATSLDRCLRYLTNLGMRGKRLGFASNLQLLEAARLTELT